MMRGGLGLRTGPVVPKLPSADLAEVSQVVQPTGVGWF